MASERMIAAKIAVQKEVVDREMARQRVGDLEQQGVDDDQEETERQQRQRQREDRAGSFR